MFKKNVFLNPALNKKVSFLFSILFLANSAYYAYHAVFTPFVPQAVNCGLVYVSLTAIFFARSVFCGKKGGTAWREIFKTFIVILFPSAVLIAVGYFFYPNDFKRNPRFFANLVIVLSSFLLFLKLFGYKKIGDFFSEFSGKKFVGGSGKKKNSWLVAAVLFVVMALNLGFGLYHLAEFAAVDEPLWTFERVPKFWNNVLDGEWHKTMISDKPGITVALLSGAGLTQASPADYELQKKEGEIRFAVNDVREMNFALRFPILLFNALMLLALYYFLSKLFNKLSALLSVIFIGLSPILLGISRIINPDSVFWVFSTLSLLAYFLFLKKNENKWLFFSAFFLGLSLLTKYVANFFFVFFFALIFIDYFMNKDGKSDWSAYFKKATRSYLALAYLSLLVFFIFLPAAWVDLSRITEGTIFSKAFLKFWQMFLVIFLIVSGEIYFLKGKISSAVLNYLSEKKNIIIKVISAMSLLAILATAVNVLFGMQWVDFETILASPKSSVLGGKNIGGVFLANFYPLIFGIHPIAFLLILVVLISMLFKKKDYHIWTAYLLILSILYYVACYLNDVGAIVRYQIMLYPLFFIIASLGADMIFGHFRKNGKLVVLAAVAIILVVSLNNIRPFYFSYASEILPQKYVLNLKDMGDGSYEAAQYLNNLPNAKDMIIWTDKRGVCYFFAGGCLDTFEMNQGMRIDYFVVSASRQSRTERHIPYKGRHNDYEIHVDKIYENENFDYKIEIGNRPNNFVKVFSYEKLANE